jgi:hypothetical protein
MLIKKNLRLIGAWDFLYGDDDSNSFQNILEFLIKTVKKENNSELILFSTLQTKKKLK